jgi:hypothetical protein
VLVFEIVPRLKNIIRVPGAIHGAPTEDAEELLQEATAIAARLLDQAETNGKTVTPGNVAYYAMLTLRAGRRFGSSGSTDVMGARTQCVGRTRVSSLQEPITGDQEDGAEQTLGDLLASEGDDPATTAARNIDWKAFMATLDEKSLAVLRCMAGEIRLQELTHTYGVCRSTIQMWRNHLTELLREFMGPAILNDVERVPVWRDGLHAVRERMECRVERRMA